MNSDQWARNEGKDARLWFIAGIGALQALVAYLMIVAVPLTIVRLGGGAYVVGMGFTAWAVGRSVMGYVSGRQFDRIGARRGIVWGFILFAVAALGYAVAGNPWVLVAARLVQGVGAGRYWAGMLSLAGGSSAGAPRIRRLTVFSALVAVGGMTGAVAGGWLMGNGVDAVMGVAGGLSLTLAVVSRWLPAGGGPRPSPGMGWALLRGPVGVLSLFTALSQLPMLLASAGLPLILLSVGFGAPAIGVENALIVGGVLVGQFVLFRFPGWAGSVRALYSLYGTVAAGLLILVAVRSSFTVMVALVLVGTGVQLLATVWTNAVQTAAGSGQVGGATGLMRSASDLLNASAYPLVGVADAYLPETSFTLALLLGVSVASLASRRTAHWWGGVFGHASGWAGTRPVAITPLPDASRLGHQRPEGPR